MVKNTILLDFDGVIRHWSNDDVESTELKLGLVKGALYSVAFNSEYLVPAITGQVNHEQWLVNVELKLEQLHGQAIAKELIGSWNSLKFNIDHDFLNEIKSRAPSASLVLVTNATSRLPSDLVKAKLKGAFDFVINSSEIHASKPSLTFFEKTLSVIQQPADCVVFIDDSLLNVEAAQSMGIDSVHHCTTTDTLEFIQNNWA